MLRTDQLARSLGDLGIAIPEESIPKLLLFLTELLRWNRHINLTAVRDEEEAVEKHLVDSLTPLPLLTGTERFLDIGSGGGLPCIPLKIVRPGLQVVSVETVGKKASFQRHAARLLDFTNFEVRQLRVESPRFREEMAAHFDLVVSRAFSSLENFVELADPFLSRCGRMIALKGPEAEKELLIAGPVLARLGLECLECRRLRLPESGAARTLVVLARR